MKKFTIESYTTVQSRRSWGACQENDNSPSAYDEYHETEYRIMYKGKIVRDGLRSKGAAEYHIKNFLTVSGINKRLSVRKKELTSQLKEVTSQHKKELLALKKVLSK